jgi:hypothetical protein
LEFTVRVHAARGNSNIEARNAKQIRITEREMIKKRNCRAIASVAIPQGRQATRLPYNRFPSFKLSNCFVLRIGKPGRSFTRVTANFRASARLG